MSLANLFKSICFFFLLSKDVDPVIVLHSIPIETSSIRANFYFNFTVMYLVCNMFCTAVCIHGQIKLIFIFMALHDTLLL